MNAHAGGEYERLLSIEKTRGANTTERIRGDLFFDRAAFSRTRRGRAAYADLPLRVREKAARCP